MTVKSLIDSVAAKYDHPYTNQDILDMINNFEKSIYTENVKELSSAMIGVVSGQETYDFPSGSTFETIEALFVNGVEYTKRDLRQYQATGYYKSGGKLALYPIPTTTDAEDAESVLVVFRMIPTTKLIANINTDTLLLPDGFLDAYSYYIYGQISLLRKQFTEAKNWLGLSNGRIQEFIVWYNNARPKMQNAYQKSKRW